MIYQINKLIKLFIYLFIQSQNAICKSHIIVDYKYSTCIQFLTFLWTHYLTNDAERHRESVSEPQHCLKLES